MALKIGFVGIGKMGAPMAERLLAAGFEVHAFNRSRAPVEQVYQEMFEHARAGQIYADHSTVSVGQSRRCAEAAHARRADFLDAPVSGGPAGAQAGTLTGMVGGGQAVFGRVLP